MINMNLFLQKSDIPTDVYCSVQYSDKYKVNTFMQINTVT